MDQGLKEVEKCIKCFKSVQTPKFAKKKKKNWELSSGRSQENEML